MSLTPHSEITAEDRREWPRYAPGGAVLLAVEAEGVVHPCTLANISLGGACLTFLEGKVPGTAQLVLRHPEVGKVNLDRRWHEGLKAGVLFEFSAESLTLVHDCLQQIMGLGRYRDTGLP